MQSNFNNRDFEQFVKQSADQYRMYPSEKVWKGIHTALHGRRRWYYGLGLALLLLTSGAVTWVMLTPDNRQLAIAQPAAQTQTASVSAEPLSAQPDMLNPKSVKSNPEAGIPFVVNKALGSEFAGEMDVMERNVSNEQLNQPVTGDISLASGTSLSMVSRQVPAGKPISVPMQVIKPARDTEKDLSNTMIVTPSAFTDAIADNNTNLAVLEEKKIDTREFYPLTIESVVNSYKRIGKKLTWQIYFTPTVSYRRLIENKDFLQATRNTNTAPGYLYIPDINNAVKHKPNMGLNLGVTAGYPVSKKLKIIAGFQFNVSKYDIQASYTYQPEQATLTLNTGYQGNSTLTANTNYRNYVGYKENWLRNLYFSASLPVGADLLLKGTHARPVFGIAATLQPIYILDNSAYLLSTDYKNYVVMPSLINQWNLGTSFEAYAGYSTGHLNWRVGPQVRYHLGSSFQKRYPVKEHLFDFGLKVGVQLNR